VQRARPIATIATVVKGVATAHVTGNWCHVYPLRLADTATEETLLPAADEWRENINKDVVSRLQRSYGRRPSVDDIAWYVFGVLSAPSYRRRFEGALSIDHPRIPFPANKESFRRLGELGLELGRVHLLEATVDPEIRFTGNGDGIVANVRYDAEAARVWINQTQAFTGVPEIAWLWGQGFRPLEHFLDERRGRRLDAEQIAGFQSAIHAVRESIRLEPALDAALDAIVSAPLGPGGTSDVQGGGGED
jgi:hypothetical protein